MFSNKTYISTGDFIDLYHKIKMKGFLEISSKLSFSHEKRAKSKWNHFVPSSDFWIIPEVRKRWNLKCTGNPELGFEAYVEEKYLKGRSNLRMLSVGSGSGTKERLFAQFPQFSNIEGIDLSPKQVAIAKEEALKENLNQIQYHCGSFYDFPFEEEAYDVILFNSSLHHLKNVNELLKNKVKPLLKDDGYLIVFEYTGPNRLQWTDLQLKAANNQLRKLPKEYTMRTDGKSHKTAIYRPGLLRMLLVDPSEAVDSEAIIPSLHEHFKVVEEKKVGWNLLMILLKDISHNFLKKDQQTQALLHRLFEEEDKFMKETGMSDATFGVYQK
jgi:SAM-dependent methyltransferase